jgi:hypothetical protein
MHTEQNPGARLTAHTLREIFAQSATHGDGECADCSACMRSLCELVETVLAGGDLHQLMPAFAQHIDECASCQEEYSALLCILEAERAGRTTETAAAPPAAPDA